MSIKSYLVKNLKNKFLFQSDNYKRIVLQEKKIAEETKILLSQEIDKIKDIQTLRKLPELMLTLTDFIGVRDERFNPEIEIYFKKNFSCGRISIYCPRSILTQDYPYRTTFSRLQGTLKEIYLEMNEKYLLLEYELARMEYSWDKLINTGTSLKFLRQTFPEIYEYLKNQI